MNAKSVSFVNGDENEAFEKIGKKFKKAKEIGKKEEISKERIKKRLEKEWVMKHGC